MTTKKEYVVEFACDADGDHAVPISECTSSDKKSFTNLAEALDFVAECSHVYNKDSLFGKHLTKEKPTAKRTNPLFSKAI